MSSSSETQQNIDPITNPTSPYYLHPSDASFILVSTPFTGNNFIDWKRSVMIALSAKNKLGFINGNISKPADSSSVFPAWERGNSTLITWFMKVLDPIIARSVLHFDSASAIWSNLHERFGQTSGTQIYSTLQQLADIQQGTNNISSFYTKMKILWDTQDATQPLPICTCTNCTCRITQKVMTL